METFGQMWEKWLSRVNLVKWGVATDEEEQVQEEDFAFFFSGCS